MFALACKCNSCTHWEIVMIEKVQHLHCKTCGTDIAVEISYLNEEEAVKAGTHWIKIDKE